MKLSSILLKMADGQTLTVGEREELRQKAETIDLVDSLVTSWVHPGTSIPRIPNLQSDNVVIANNDVHLDQYGVFLKNQEGEIGFESLDGASDSIAIYSDGGDDLVLKNQIGGTAGILMDVDSTTHDVMEVSVNEDAGLLERLLLRMSGGVQGERLTLGDTIEIMAEGDSGGLSAIKFTANTSAVPTAAEFLTDSNQAMIYIRAGKFVIRYPDAGQQRYKYLDLTGTGVTWTHTTTPP